jgi:uncharacterized protein
MTGLDSTTTSAPAATAPAPRVRWAAVLVFLVVAYGGGWLLALPLWRGGGLASPLFLPLGLAVMATPALGALVATRLVIKPPHVARSLALVPLRPWRRTLGYALLGFVGVQVIGVAAIAVAWVTGAASVQVTPGAWTSLLTMQLLGVLVAVAALGEEIGWRGFLLPMLRPLGTWRALLLSGLAWGPWHAPLVLLGYNYGTTHASGVALMTVTTVLLGVLFGWLRMRTASVYPSALAHGALNASAGTLLAGFVPGGAATTASVLGWAGWLVVALLIAVLAATRSFRWARPGV